MNIKKVAQNMIGSLRSRKNGVKVPNGGVYIGRRVHIVNGKKIELGKNVAIRPDVDLFARDKIRIGDGCDIGTRNRIVGNVIIEKKVLFGPDNYICSVDHCYEDINVPIIEQGAYVVNNNGHDELKIGEGSWIGTHVAIIGNVHIGKNCVIGANAVVTRDVPDFSVAVGIPAKVIKRYNCEKKQWERVSCT